MADVAENQAMKIKFEEKFSALKIAGNSSRISNLERYNEIVKEVENAKAKKEKSSLDYRRLKRYDVLKVGDYKKLITPLSKKHQEVKYFLCDNEIFDAIHQAHLGCGHGGRDRTEKTVSEKYSNVTRDSINLYLQLCVICKKNRTLPKKGLVAKPLKEFNERAQVDLIDMQTCKDGDFKFIMNYQDHFTKFVILKPLKFKTAEEVSRHLLDIFCNYGAPSVLQCDNDREFVNKVISELKVLWPTPSIVHGNPRANQDVQNFLTAWMKENNTVKWSEGLRFCQIQKNTAYHSAIKQTPFEAMFGRKAHIGIGKLPNYIKNELYTEEDLEHASRGDQDEIFNDHENNSNKANDLVISGSLQKSSFDNNILADINERVPEESTIICNNKKEHNSNKIRAEKGLKRQAEKMLSLPNNKFGKMDVGSFVKVPILSVDRSKGDFRNIIGVVMEETKEGYYKVGSNQGIINTLFSRNQIDVWNEHFLNISEVPTEPISLCTTNNKESLFGDQGYVRCNCTKKCNTNTCKCKKLKILCNSKCHSSTTCCNK